MRAGAMVMYEASPKRALADAIRVCENGIMSARGCLRELRHIPVAPENHIARPVILLKMSDREMQISSCSLGLAPNTQSC